MVGFSVECSANIYKSLDSSIAPDCRSGVVSDTVVANLEGMFLTDEVSSIYSSGIVQVLAHWFMMFQPQVEATKSQSACRVQAVQREHHCVHFADFVCHWDWEPPIDWNRSFESLHVLIWSNEMAHKNVIEWWWECQTRCVLEDDEFLGATLHPKLLAASWDDFEW